MSATLGEGAFAPVGDAIETIARGGIVVVVDAEERENEGDLIMAAEHATADKLGFFVRHTSGIVCVSLEPGRVDALGLAPMVPSGEDRQGTAFTISVDHRDTTTGISASERARTVRALADPELRPEQLLRPGHVFPLRSRRGGVLRRAGHTEAAVDLVRLAGKEPAGVLAEVTADEGSRMARLPDLIGFAEAHGLPLISIDDLVRHRLRHDRLVERVAETRMPTDAGAFRCLAWESAVDGCKHLALTMGAVGDGRPVLVRVHSECLTGDVFGSRRCDCGVQLDLALARIAREGRGVLLYLRGQEGRGIGIAHKLRAYGLQDNGLDTVDANLELGLPVDRRDYGIGAQILLDLGVRELRLLTNNPAKYSGLGGYGMRIVERVAIQGPPTPDNLLYLQAKRERLGHVLEELGDVPR